MNLLAAIPDPMMNPIAYGSLILTGLGMIIAMVSGQRKNAADTQDLKNGLGEVKTTTTDLKFGVQRLETKTAELQLGQTTTLGKIDAVDAKVTDVRDDVKDHENRIRQVEAQIRAGG